MSSTRPHTGGPERSSTFATVNPATGELVATFEELSDVELEARIALGADAFERARATTYADRAAWLDRAAARLERDCERTATLVTTEMGKTLASARAEVRKCAVALRFYAEHGEALLADEPADPDAVGARRALARYEPLGPVLAVMPWNFPLWQVIRFAAPALMAGNVGLLKHAPNVPQVGDALEELFLEAGVPPGMFQNLRVGVDAVAGIIRDPRVRAVTLTGSTSAGRAVASVAGEQLKKTVLELGGSDPFLVLPSADVARAAAVAATSRCQNAGQSCIAAKRFIVHDAVAEEFEARFVEAMSALEVGDPLVADTDVGPLATARGRADVEAVVADAVARGAEVLCGGVAPDAPGWYYPPTVVTGLEPSMRMYHEEVFGPVAQLFRVPDLDAALAIANSTCFGLGANVWTTDDSEAETCLRRLHAGAVFVNGMVTSYPELPFGGIKDSGHGRELGAHGMREFCNLKTIWIG